jgi:hypothetical protein
MDANDTIPTARDDSPPSWVATEEYVSGPFRMETIPGVGHFITDQAPDPVTTLPLAHLAANAARASSSVP